MSESVMIRLYSMVLTLCYVFGWVDSTAFGRTFDSVSWYGLTTEFEKRIFIFALPFAFALQHPSGVGIRQVFQVAPFFELRFVQFLATVVESELVR